MAYSISNNNQAPWYLEPNDCIGDSLGYLNQNAAFTTTLAASASFNALTTNVNTLSGYMPIYTYQSTAGSAIGNATTYTPYFDSLDSIISGRLYEVYYELWYTKTTAGKITFAIGSTNIDCSASLLQSPAGGIGTAAAGFVAGINNTSLATYAFPETASLTTAVKHYSKITAVVKCNTTDTLTLTFKSSAGTITPLIGSYRKITRIS
jgi:hypothetical protein